MRANLALHPPVVILPLPALDQVRLRVVLAYRRQPPPRVMSPVLGAPFVTFLRRFVRAAVRLPRRVARVAVARVLTVLAVEGARPPPDSLESFISDGPVA